MCYSHHFTSSTVQLSPCRQNVGNEKVQDVPLSICWEPSVAHLALLQKHHSLPSTTLREFMEKREGTTSDSTYTQMRRHNKDWGHFSWGCNSIINYWTFKFWAYFTSFVLSESHIDFIQPHNAGTCIKNLSTHGRMKTGKTIWYGTYKICKRLFQKIDEQIKSDTM